MLCCVELNPTEDVLNVPPRVATKSSCRTSANSQEVPANTKVLIEAARARQMSLTTIWEVGEGVKVIIPFNSNDEESQDILELKRGDEGRVAELDEEGDIWVNFKKDPSQYHWVFKDNFKHLQKVEAGTPASVNSRRVSWQETSNGAEGMMKARRQDRRVRTRKLSVAKIKAAAALAKQSDTAVALTKSLDPKKLKTSGFSAEEMISAGFSILQLKDAGYDAGDMLDGEVPALDLKQAGFTARELYRAGYEARDLKAAGFDFDQMRLAGFRGTQLVQVGWRAQRLSLRDAGYDAEELLAAGFTGAQLRDAGFQAGDLHEVGFEIGDLKESGFTILELTVAGWDEPGPLAAGYIPVWRTS